MSITGLKTSGAIEIAVNGERLSVPEGLSVAGLLEHLGLKAGKVAVEHNLSIVPRSAHGLTLVRAGDRIEIVHFIGGGR